jgi:hypothetical protein
VDIDRPGGGGDRRDGGSPKDVDKPVPEGRQVLMVQQHRQPKATYVIGLFGEQISNCEVVPACGLDVKNRRHR